MQQKDSLQTGSLDCDEESDNISEETLSDTDGLPIAKWH